MQNFAAGLARRLGTGLRLLFFLPAPRHDSAPTWRQIVVLMALGGALWLLVDRLTAPQDARLTLEGLARASFLVVCFAGTLLFFLPAGRNDDATPRIAGALAGAFPAFVLIALGVSLLTEGAEAKPYVVPALALLGGACLYRALRLAPGSSAAAALCALAVIGMTWAVFEQTVKARPRFFVARDDAAPMLHPPEDILFRQPLLISEAVTRLAPQRPGHTDVYFIGFAGDGHQAVFSTEVAFARDALSRKFDLAGRVLELKNAPQLDPAAPVATQAGLRLALQQVAQVMDVDEDVLILFLTSHGTESAHLKIHRPELALRDLSAQALSEALRDAGIKWRVVIISACYSGSFIEALRDEHTLVVTAARGDRKSFGCRDNRELTYYGEALFREALPDSDSLLDAVAQAAAAVSARERAEGFEPSEPQLYVGGKMRTFLPHLSFDRTVAAAEDTQSLGAIPAAAAP